MGKAEVKGEGHIRENIICLVKDFATYCLIRSIIKTSDIVIVFTNQITYFYYI